jgi:hypothetical protein
MRRPPDHVSWVAACVDAGCPFLASVPTRLAALEAARAHAAVSGHHVSLIETTARCTEFVLPPAAATPDAKLN